MIDRITILGGVMKTRMDRKKGIMPRLNNPRGRKPDYKLKLKDEKTERWMEVGAAWKNHDGSISVKLNMCVVLNERLGVAPVLFPHDPEEEDVPPFKPPDSIVTEAQDV